MVPGTYLNAVLNQASGGCGLTQFAQCGYLVGPVIDVAVVAALAVIVVCSIFYRAT